MIQRGGGLKGHIIHKSYNTVKWMNICFDLMKMEPWKKLPQRWYMAERNLKISPMKVAFHRRTSPIEGLLPSKIVFHKRLSSIEGCLSSKVAFPRRLSSIEGRLPSKVVFHWRSSSNKGRLPMKVVFHRRTYRGERTHNVTQWTDTQFFFYKRTDRRTKQCIEAACCLKKNTFLAQILTE